MRNGRLEFVQGIGMQDVPFATLLGEIELKCTKASLTHTRGHSAGAAESLDGAD